MRTCKTCGVEKPLEDYPAAAGYRQGRKPHCRPCYYESSKKYSTPAKKQEWQRKHAYGLDGPGFAALLAAQGGGCGICHEPLHKPHVDHCHTTGKVRGLLCKLCNAGLGQFNDNVSRLRRAADYLEQSRRV